jgi:hypothetical protein
VAGNDCPVSLQFCALRVARLAADGTTPAGATNMIVTDKQIRCQVTPQFEAGDDITFKTGCGAIAAAYKDVDRLKRVDIELQVATLDPELAELIAGYTLITQGGNSTGAAYPAVGATPGPGVSIEGWTKAWMGGGPPPGQTFTDGVTTNASPTVTSATATFTSADIGRTITGTGIPGGTTIIAVGSGVSITMSANATATATGVTIVIGRPGAYIRWAFPKVLFAPGVRTLEDAPMVSVFSGPGSENPSWGNGPNNDWPSGAQSGRCAAWVRDAALPTVSCGYVTVPAQI